MTSKECKVMTRHAWIVLAATSLPPAVSAMAGEISSIRVRSSAVVTASEITLGDLCDFPRDMNVAARIGMEFVARAPRPGRSAGVSAVRIQDALRRAGVNLATVVVTGAMHCEVSRPAGETPHARISHDDQPADESTSSDGLTLHQAVRYAFERNTRSLGGSLNLRFGRTDAETLNVSDSDHTFHVRVRGGRWLGRMIKVEVEVRSGDGTVQKIPLVVHASISKRVVVGRRPINQKATIGIDDVELAERVYDEIPELVLSDLNAVIGQRAKRFLPAGRPLRATDLQSVPLVKRGQIVQVVSTAGGVEVRSVAKAVADGGMGDVVELRAGGRRGSNLTGVVTGSRRVVIGRSVVVGAHASSGGRDAS